MALRRLWRSSIDVVALQVSILLVALIGFVAMGTEVVSLLMTQRQMQAAADSGALAAVTARTREYPPAYADEAVALDRAAGYVQGQDGATVTATSPPTSGSYASTAGAIWELPLEDRGVQPGYVDADIDRTRYRAFGIEQGMSGADRGVARRHSESVGANGEFAIRQDAIQQAAVGHDRAQPNRSAGAKNRNCPGFLVLSSGA